MSAAEDRAAEWQACNSCGTVKHHTELNDDGECRDCARQVREVKQELQESRARVDWKQAYQDLRDWITTIPAAHHAAVQNCPACGKRVFLVCGRISGKFFFVHEYAYECQRGKGVYFDTKEEATL